MSGILAPVPTSFDDDGDLDTSALTENVTRLARSRLAGLLALGSNGEAAFLSEDEGDRVIATARGAWPRERVLMAGIGRESTRGTIDAARRAAACGADAVLVKMPSAFRAQVGPDAIARHMLAVADASPVPVLLYNLPGPTGVTVTLPTIEVVAAHPNIIGMKETSADLERLGQFAAVRPDAFAVLTGWAPVLYPALTAGAVGGILAVANVIPDVCVAVFDHMRAGRHAEALELQRRMTPLAQLVTTGHGVPGLKFALDQCGGRGGPVRAPLSATGDAAREAILAALEPWRV